jgi:hypothetical protein
MKEENEELLKKVIEIEKAKSKEDTYKYMIAKYLYSSKQENKSKKVQSQMISVSSIEEYFNTEIANDCMQRILEDFLRTICLSKMNMYDYSLRIIKHYELIIKAKCSNKMTDEEAEFRNMFKAIMLTNCELQKNEVSESVIKQIKEYVEKSDSLSIELLKELANEISISKLK